MQCTYPTNNIILVQVTDDIILRDLAIVKVLENEEAIIGLHRVIEVCRNIKIE